MLDEFLHSRGESAAADGAATVPEDVAGTGSTAGAPAALEGWHRRQFHRRSTASVSRPTMTHHAHETALETKAAAVLALPDGASNRKAPGASNRKAPGHLTIYFNFFVYTHLPCGMSWSGRPSRAQRREDPCQGTSRFEKQRTLQRRLSGGGPEDKTKPESGI